ncbi:lactamase [Coprinopsis sp. MPI-PUGE-AT-0042]|nr:lactamase [Coprinopsis sp. MPI-PUGE-AT-0042]
MAATALEDIPDITKLSERVTRVLGQNPGRFTLQGTNTYLIGSSNPYILIDTGEGLDAYIPILKDALSNPTNPSLPDVSDIILSHWHHDHVGGLSSVLSLLHDLWKARNSNAEYKAPKLHKFPLPKDALKDIDARWNTLPKLLAEIPREFYTPSSSDSPLHDLSQGQILHSHSKDISLQVIHSPGHTLDSISLWIKEDNALFTADTVLGQGTSVFEDLGLYLSSLQRLLSFLSSTDNPVLYPSHGPIVKKGKETIEMYIKHRLEREAQVVGLLGTTPPSGSEAWSTWDIVKTLYASYPENLWEPAMRGIELHLKKLKEEGRVERVGDGTGKEAKWKLVKGSSPSL